MGRPKGSKNKAPLAFRDRLRAYCQEIGVDPFHFMADCLKKPKLENAYKIQCAKELAKYLEPQLRSIEVSGPDGGPLQHADASLESRLNEVIAELERARNSTPRLLEAPTNGHA